MSATVYSAIYGEYDTIRWQPVPVFMFTEQVSPMDGSTPMMAAKFWKMHPHLACPDAEISIWIDGSIDVLRPDFPELCVEALGDADAIFVRHPWSDDITEEAIASLRLHPTKYAGQPLMEQVAAYREAGHPDHWGLAHCAVLVRRHTDAVQALDAAWWAETLRWSVQDQLSLPHLLRTMPLRYRWFDVSPLDVHPADAAWVHWGTHEGEGHGDL